MTTQALEPNERLRQSTAVALLAAVIVLGAALRIHFVDSALWYDEIVTLTDSARAPVASIVTQFPSNNNHVLYSLLAHAAIAVFGEHAWTLRLPALLFGIASLPMLYLLGSAAATRSEALWATALLAVSYHHVWFSQNARGYTILLFCALLSTYLLLAGLRSGRRVPYVAFAIVSALSAYTHLTMVLFVVGQALVVAFHIVMRHGWRASSRDLAGPVFAFAGAGALTVLLYAPMLLEVGAFFGREPKAANVATAGWAVAETLRGLRLGYAVEGALAIGAMLGIVGCASYYRRDPLVLGLFVVPGAFLLALVVVLQRPTFPRFFFFLAGFALLILVRGTYAAVRWGLRSLLPDRPASGRAHAVGPAFALAVMTAISAAALPAAYRYPKQDYLQASSYVEAYAGGADRIVLAGGGTAVPYRTYFGKPWDRLANAAHLAGLRERHDVWVLYTFRRYVEGLEPDLAREISDRCTVARTFRGTVADGDIYVARCPRGP